MDAKQLSFNNVHFQSHCMVLTIVSGSRLQTLPPKRIFPSNPGDVAPINVPDAPLLWVHIQVGSVRR